MKTAAGLIFDDSSHYLDHLAPFCAMQNWPLILCEGDLADLARRYYPGVEIIEANRWDIALPQTVVSCYPRGLIESAFGSSASREFLWLPHGNSDKGWKIPFFDPLQGESALVYGQRMIDYIHEKKIFPKMIRIGNFRLEYWKKQIQFYDAIVAKEIPLPQGNKTFLYAPTWNDAEENGSFWETFPDLVEALPNDVNLLVKIHPNTAKQFAVELECLIGRFADRKNLSFLLEFPPIYPLLNITDVYIGDMSSIGYDFLYWQRPMYFVKKRAPSQFLFRCGMEIEKGAIGSIFQRSDPPPQKTQAEIYAYTFDPYRAIPRLREVEQIPR